MTLSRPVKLLVAALTVWPIVYILVFFAFAAMFILWAPLPGGSGTDSQPPAAFLAFFAAHLGTMFLTFGLSAFYVIYLFKTDRVPQDKKALRAVVLLLGNVMTMPVFFYLYIWPDEWPRATARARV